jgi:hypothetical protein
MAQEINVTVNSNITLAGQTASGSTNFRLDLTNDFLGEEQTIPITATALDFGDMTAMKTLYIRNMDTANAVTIDAVTAMTAFPQVIPPGCAILLLPSTATIYAKAQTAPVKVWLVAG